jgi:hypothetical protein
MTNVECKSVVLAPSLFYIQHYSFIILHSLFHFSKTVSTTVA